MEKVKIPQGSRMESARVGLIKDLSESMVSVYGDEYNGHFFQFVNSLYKTNCYEHFIQIIFESPFDANIFENNIYIDKSIECTLRDEQKKAILKLENINKLLAMNRFIINDS